MPKMPELAGRIRLQHQVLGLPRLPNWKQMPLSELPRLWGSILISENALLVAAELLAGHSTWHTAREEFLMQGNTPRPQKEVALGHNGSEEPGPGHLSCVWDSPAQGVRWSQ